MAGRRAAGDAVALLAFVAIGILTHEASFTAFVRDALCILGGWFAVAGLVHVYTRGGWWRLGATWLVGVSLGVLVRAAIVGRWPGAFYGVALAFTALFVAGGRLVSRAR
jgi:hypothetical protein